MTVLVLTEDLDPTADHVVDLLTTADVPVLRCDTSWFPQRLQLDADLSGGRVHGHLATPERSVRLEHLRSVWYRRPTAFGFPAHWYAAQRRHAAYEAKFGLGGVLWTLPVLWVNHPARQADLYKPTQLAIAARCGLPVPDTVVTNDPERLRHFFGSHADGVVVKPMGLNTIPGAEGHQHVIFTRLLSYDDLQHVESVRHTAHLFQAFVPKRYDVRLTAVGQRLFAAAIHTDSPTAQVDYRIDYRSISCAIVDVPHQVRKGVEQFMAETDLAYGAFDFAVDRDGRWWFLECNPGGQYGFIEHTTGLPISAALAHLLTEGYS